DPVILRGYLDDRVQALSARAAQFDHQRGRLWPGQTVADDLVVEHARLRIRAELDWHELVLDQLGKLTADSERADAERTDAAPADAGRADAARADAARADAGRADAGRADVARADVARADAGRTGAERARA